MLRGVAALVGLVLAAVACVGGGQPATPVGRSGAPATPTSAPGIPSAAASPAPRTGDPSVVAVTVTFDGERCTYAGPHVVPDGVALDFSYEVDGAGPAPMALLVGPVADPLEDGERAWVASGEPDLGRMLADLVKLEWWRFQYGPTAAPLRVLLRHDEDEGVPDQAGYFVGCLPEPDYRTVVTIDDLADAPVWPAAIIDVMEP